MSNYILKVFNSSLTKSTLLYTVGDCIGKAIPFVLLPVVARYLATSDFGILTNFNVAFQIFTAICALNTYSALTVSYYTLDSDGLASYISNLIYLIFILAIVCFVFSNLFTNVIYNYLGISTLWQNLALLSAVATSIFNLCTALLRMQNRIVLFNSVQIFQSLVASLLAIVFVVILKWNWQGRVLSIVIGALVSMLSSLWLMKKGLLLFKKLNSVEVKTAFSFGLPLLPHTLSFWFKSGVDKIILTNFVNLSANGIYSIGLTLVSIIGIFTGSFFNAYSPLMYKDLSLIDQLQETEGHAIKLKLVKMTYLFAVMLLAVCIASHFIMDSVVPMLFKGDYLNCLMLLPFLMITLYFEGLFSIVSGYIFYRKKTKVLGIITFSSSLLQMLITFIMVRNFGIMGAAYSSSIISLLTFLAVFVYANTLYDLPWGLRSTPLTPPV